MDEQDLKEWLKPQITPHTGQTDENGDLKFPKANVANHQWVQRGHSMHCDGPDCLAHGYNLGHDQILTGVDLNGFPVFEPVTLTEPQNIEGPDIEKVAKA